MCFLKITLLNQIHIRMTMSNCIVTEEFIFCNRILKTKSFTIRDLKEKKKLEIYSGKKKKVQNINGVSIIILKDLYMESPGWISHIAVLDALM